jgi:23S rRNA (cytosine1962-C5)-methyltransferase
MALPTVMLTVKGASLVRAGRVLIPRPEVGAPDGPGDVVRLIDSRRGEVLGTGIYSARSPIAVRVLSDTEEGLTPELLSRRIRAALARRQALFGQDPLLRDADAFRVVHGEADGLPGLFVDRYAAAAVIQTTAPAMDTREAEIGALLHELLAVPLIVVRDDGSARDLEALPRRRGVLRGPAGSTRVRFHDAGALVEADLLHDGKTGSFLDQQENHAAAYRYAAMFGSGDALDAFTYHGGFALALARAGLSVLACDERPQAASRARHNAELNRLQIDVRTENAFDLLRRLEAGGRRFALIALDPPALAKRGGRGPEGRPLSTALRAYRELNLRALRLLQPGGVLLTCSCSARVSPADFSAVVREAAADAGGAIQLLERRGAGRDHPVLLGVPESEYLKCLVLMRVG